MQSSAQLRREAPTAAGSTSPAQGQVLAGAAGREAANDEALEASSEYRPNPLWVVNGAMAAFFIIAAIVLASD